MSFDRAELLDSVDNNFMESCSQKNLPILTNDLITITDETTIGDRLQPRTVQQAAPVPIKILTHALIWLVPRGHQYG